MDYEQQINTEEQTPANEYHQEKHELKWIPKHKLWVDHTYQRKVGDDGIQEMADNWNWTSCGSLNINIRSDDEPFPIIDGQRRWLAALRVTRITELPCNVFRLKTIEEEAKAFLAQKSRKQIRPYDTYNALLITKDPPALLVQELCGQHKTPVRSGGVREGDKGFSCVGELLIWAKKTPALLRDVFPVLEELLANGGKITWELLRGLMFMGDRLFHTNESLADEKWKQRIISVGTKEMIEEGINLQIRIEGRRNQLVYAQGILSALNRKQKHQLFITGVTPGTVKKRATLNDDF